MIQIIHQPIPTKQKKKKKTRWGSSQEAFQGVFLIGLRVGVDTLNFSVTSRGFAIFLQGLESLPDKFLVLNVTS
jgi:hypothetical protein